MCKYVLVLRPTTEMLQLRRLAGIHPSIQRSCCPLGIWLSGDPVFFVYQSLSGEIKRSACVEMLANTRLSQPWRSCGSSEFLLKNNLIEKLLLPSASGRHTGHTQEHSAACGQPHKGCVHVWALGKRQKIQSFLSQSPSSTHSFQTIVRHF